LDFGLCLLVNYTLTKELVALEQMQTNHQLKSTLLLYVELQQVQKCQLIKLHPGFDTKLMMQAKKVLLPHHNKNLIFH